MLLDIDEAVELTRLEKKITTIIPTSAAPIECFMWSIFSWLLRADPKDYIEHFIVVINGPDKRTGDPTIGDKKQAFLEELRNLKWWRTDKPQNKKDMPLTVMRAWSRIGHPEAVEMAVPWVHTEAYLITHDDVFIIKDNWLRDTDKAFWDRPEVAISYGTPFMMCCQQDSAMHQNKHLLRFPHLLCAFLLCKKKILSKLGSSWCGYSIKTDPFLLKDKVGDVAAFKKYYADLQLNDNPSQEEQPYEFISMEMGAWHFYNAVQAGYKFSQLDQNMLIHLGAMSWEVDTGKKRRIEHYQDEIFKLEQLIYRHPEYSRLYLKYLPEDYKNK